MKFDDEVLKQLDAVVGESYEPPTRWRATLAKWLAFAVLAVGMSALVNGILHTHVMQAQTAAEAQRPVKPQKTEKTEKPVPIFVVPQK